MPQTESQAIVQGLNNCGYWSATNGRTARAATFTKISHHVPLCRSIFFPRESAAYTQPIPALKATPNASFSRRPVRPSTQTLEQARIEVEREHELECIRGAAAELIRQREEEARQVLEMKQAAVEAEREKEELRRRRREEAARRRVAREKVACLQLVRQVLPLSLERALAQLSQKSWVTPSIHQVGGRRHKRSIWRLAFLLLC